MMFLYHVQYIPEEDEFYASVEVAATDEIVFEIESTEMMRELIQNKTMDHIDDIPGLKQHLIHHAILQPQDILQIATVTL